MSMQNPISDMFTRIRNALSMAKKEVSVPKNKLKKAILEVLKNEGYISDYKVANDGPKGDIVVTLKYYEGKPVIDELVSVSKPSLRVYKRKDEIPKVNGGLGIAIVSTSKGVVSDSEARRLGLGGEILCYVN